MLCVVKNGGYDRVPSVIFLPASLPLFMLFTARVKINNFSVEGEASNLLIETPVNNGEGDLKQIVEKAFAL